MQEIIQWKIDRQMSQKRIRYCLFDFDGTIVDSMPFLENNAVQLLVKNYKFDENTARTKYRKTTGLPFVQQMEIISPETAELNKRIVKRFEEMKIEKIYEQKLFKESVSVLSKLKKLDYLIGISSGTIEAIIIDFLKKANLDLVDDILGWKPGFEKGKDHFQYLMNKYQLNQDQILFIGDSLNDAKRAIDFKIKFIGRIGMFKSLDFQKIASELNVISSLNEIFNYLPETN